MEWGATAQSHQTRLTRTWPGDLATCPLREAILFIGNAVWKSSMEIQLPCTIRGSGQIIGEVKKVVSRRSQSRGGDVLRCNPETPLFEQ